MTPHDWLNFLRCHEQAAEHRHSTETPEGPGNSGPQASGEQRKGQHGAAAGVVRRLSQADDRSPASGAYEAGLVREHHGLDPVPELQLGQQVGHVALDGGVADDQLGGDLGVGKASGDELEDLPSRWVSPGSASLAPGGGVA
jgi:hypothetical protein